MNIVINSLLDKSEKGDRIYLPQGEGIKSSDKGRRYMDVERVKKVLAEIEYLVSAVEEVC